MILAVFAVLAIAEAVVLFYGQRRLFWAANNATGSRLLAYILAAPGTVLHESAHYLTAMILGVPAGDRVLVAGGKRGRVSFFFPKTAEDGSVTLGSVPVAASDPLRSALISIAPVLLVPPLLAGLTALLLGVAIPSWSSFEAAALWKEILWLYLAFSCGQAAFPSAGDHIGVVGALALILLGAAIILLLAAQGGTAQLTHVARAIVFVLAVPASAALASLAVLGGIGSLRRPQQVKK